MILRRRISVIAAGGLTFLASISWSPSMGDGEGKNPKERPARSATDGLYTSFDTIRTDLSDYIWPTNASTVITSMFADYRRTHLHEGIDISTNNQNGYPVYASRAGYVSRIFVSRRGYGKMLTVRHPDGFVTMYAHLQRFKDPIDEYVKKIQKQTRRYSLEIDLDPALFPVSKGDVIAYTGSTGVGPAHLHFEFRDSSFNPINPLLLPQVATAVTDAIPPKIHSVAFTPLDRSSKVQGRTKAWIDDALEEDAATYTLAQPVKLNGLIGISVRATDQADVLKYVVGCYRFELSIDGELMFTSVKNYILESEAHYVSSYYDKNLIRSRKGRFEKLYVESGNRLPFYDRLPEGTGYIDTSELEAGEHVLRIATWDRSGNESSLTTILVTGSPSRK